MSKKSSNQSASAKVSKAADGSDEPADSGEQAAAETSAEPQTYRVRLVGPGNDHKTLRTRNAGTLDFQRRGPAQDVELTAAQARELRRKGWDVTANAPEKQD